MRDEQFETIMDAWAERVLQDTPKMRPRAEMYRTVEAKRRQRSVVSALLRPPLWRTAVGAAMVFLVAVVASQPWDQWQRPVVPEAPVLAMRQGLPGEKGIVMRGAVLPPKGSRKGGGDLLERLLFLWQREGATAVEGLDLRFPQDEMLTLSSADNYRLLLELSRETHVYAFQVSTSGDLIQLVPNERCSAAANPLPPGQAWYLPEEPNWFYPGQGEGWQQLYVVTSTESLPSMEKLYTEYQQAGREGGQPSLAALLQDIEDAVRDTPDQATAWEFRFRHE